MISIKHLRKTLVLLSILTIAAGIAAAPAQAHKPTKSACYVKAHGNKKVLRKCLKWRRQHIEKHECRTSVVKIIHCIFGAEGDRAVRVARCESGLDPTARNPNGRWGLWQFGPDEIAAYGYGKDAWSQTKGAKRYWNISGWGPWAQSKPCWG